MEKKNLIALVAVVVLGAGAYLVMKSPEKGQRTGEAPRPVAQLKAADVAHLEIVNEKQEKTVLDRKSPTAWRIVQPKDWAADNAAVKSLTDSLEKMGFGDLVSEDPAKQADLGVADGKAARVTAKDASGKTLADIYVGKAVSGFTMLRPVGKNEVWQATGIFAYLLNRDPKGWRDHAIFSLAANDVDKYTVDAGGSKLELEKEAADKDKPAETKWKIASSSGEAPKSAAELDMKSVTDAVQALSSLRAADFADDKQPNQVGLDKPSFTDTAGVKNEAHTLLVGNTNGDDVYVKRADDAQIYTMKKMSLERLMKRPIDFRDKTLVKAKEDDIAEIDLTHGGEATQLIHDGATWKGKGKSAVDQTKVKPVVTAFENLSGDSFSTEKDPVKTGLKKPAAVATIKLKSKQTVTIDVGAQTPDKSGYYVQKAGSPEVLVVKKYAVDRFLKKPAELAKK